ncbi:MAG TPA: hypothetical protein PKH93_06765 [Chitinophagales bacterium]|nr:hypothetical protein [Chitinophagales bacterium]HNL07259.1 hypothetical protein [Chitinophagales bacterium]
MLKIVGCSLHYYNIMHHETTIKQHHFTLQQHNINHYVCNT